MDVRDIKFAIMSSNLSSNDLNEISMVIKFARSQLAKQVKQTLRIGQQVRFNGRNGPTVGTLTKIALKFGTVRVGQVNWKVPLSMLELSEALV
jgi:hypothetical protein